LLEKLIQISIELPTEKVECRTARPVGWSRSIGITSRNNRKPLGKTARYRTDVHLPLLTGPQDIAKGSPSILLPSTQIVVLKGGKLQLKFRTANLGIAGKAP
jgi:hypothetical protein